MTDRDAVYEVADELRAIASLGLRFAQTPYDRERYEKVLHAAARLVAALEDRPAEEVLAAYRDNLGHAGPQAGVEAVVVRDGRLLLIRRTDDGLWAMPGGFADVGETLAGAAERELWEEAGLRGRAVRLLGLFDSRRWRSRVKAQMYHVVFQVEAAGEPSPGEEALDAAFFPEEALPELSAGHHLRVPAVFRLLRGEIPAPYFDPAEAP